MHPKIFRATIAAAATAFSFALIAAPMAQAVPNDGRYGSTQEATMNSSCSYYTQRAALTRAQAHDAFQRGDLGAYRMYNAEAARLQAVADQACSA